MEQLPLFENTELKPISSFLHVWTDAKRAALNKKPPFLASSGEALCEQGDERGVMRQKPAQAKCQPNRQAGVPAS